MRIVRRKKKYFPTFQLSNTPESVGNGNTMDNSTLNSHRSAHGISSNSQPSEIMRVGTRKKKNLHLHASEGVGNRTTMDIGQSNSEFIQKCTIAVHPIHHHRRQRELEGGRKNTSLRSNPQRSGRCWKWNFYRQLDIDTQRSAHSSSSNPQPSEAMRTATRKKKVSPRSNSQHLGRRWK